MMDVSPDITLAEVNQEPEKGSRRRRKRGTRQASNTRAVQNINQIDRNVEHYRNGMIYVVANDGVQDTSVTKLTREHQNPDELPTTNDLKNSAKTIKGKKKGKVPNKADRVYGPQDINHIDILSNLSLEDACDGLTSCKIDKLMASERESALSYVANGAPNLLVLPRPFAATAQEVCTRRKLLILDINGLLADIVMPPPLDYKADTHISGRAIFKRPYYYDFLKFCCERFDVGIWSSRSKRIVDRVVDYLLGDLKHKLLFCWDMCHCTETGFKTLENRYKPLVCKELGKLWEKHYPNLPWEKGDYDESNTLLIDDSPYKALLNPDHTAIFPYSYSYGDKNDNSLGPGGDLRVYLEGLAITGNIQKYIEQHPFGQRAIDETSSVWDFYSRVLRSRCDGSTRKL